MITTTCPTCDGRKQLPCWRCQGGCDLDYRCNVCGSSGVNECHTCRGGTIDIPHPIEALRHTSRFLLGSPTVNLDRDDGRSIRRRGCTGDRIIVRYKPAQVSGPKGTRTVLREGTFATAEQAEAYMRAVEGLLHKEAKRERSIDRRPVAAA